MGSSLMLILITELHINMNNRFKLEKSTRSKDGWVLTDTENLVVIRFKEHQYNNTQKISILEESDLTNNPSAASIMATIMREMGDYMASNHYCIAMPYNVRIAIGQRIKKLRLQSHLSQRDLASLTGCTNANIANVELGKYSVGLDVLSNIAEKLGCNVELIEKTAK